MDYLHRALLELTWAVRDGVDVRGYFGLVAAGQLQGADGYKQRFGLVYVDYPDWAPRAWATRSTGTAA